MSRMILSNQRNCPWIAAALVLLTAPMEAGAADSRPQNVRVFAPSQVQEVYRVLLDRDALLLESITDVIKQKDVQDGEVLVTAGSVQECSYHYVTSTALKAKNAYKTVKGPFEILNAGGIIAAGEPHLHITLSSPGKGAFGGHLEKGCRVLYLAEITIFKYSGPALTRRENENGISLLQAK
jgi:predicted DNA-binding protein with PD1-like motif